MAGISNALARSSTIDGLLATTLDKYYKSGAMQDAIFKSNPTFAMLKQAGKIEYADGGYNIVVNQMYDTNKTVGSYSRAEPVRVDPQDGMTQYVFPWAQYHGAVSIDGLSRFQNSGAAGVVKLVKEKLEQTIMTFSEIMNEHLHDVANLTYTSSTAATGNSGKNIISLPLVCAAAPGTANFVFGGIRSDTYAWNRNQVVDANANNLATIRNGIRSGYMASQRGTGGAADVGITDFYTYASFEMALDSQVRYLDPTKDATMGFDGIKHHSAKIFWDEHVADMYGNGAGTYYNWDSGSWDRGCVFFLNTKFLKLMVAKGVDFKPDEILKPIDQDARIINFWWYGQLVTSCRRKQVLVTEMGDKSTPFTS